MAENQTDSQSLNSSLDDVLAQFDESNVQRNAHQDWLQPIDKREAGPAGPRLFTRDGHTRRRSYDILGSNSLNQSLDDKLNDFIKGTPDHSKHSEIQHKLGLAY